MRSNADTETALRAWQSGVGLVADGIAGPRCLSALGIAPVAELTVSVDGSLESDLRMPVLGLENVFDPGYGGRDGSPGSAEDLANWRSAMASCQLGERLTIHAEEKFIARRGNGADLPEQTASSLHGGFDNNVEVIGRTLRRITGAPLALPVDDLVGF